MCLRLHARIVTTYTPANSHILQWTDGNIVPGWDLIKFFYWFPFISFYSSFCWCFYHCIWFLFSLQLCPAQLHTYYYIFSIELHLSFNFIPVSLLCLFFFFFHISVVSTRLLSIANLCMCSHRFPWSAATMAHTLMHVAETDSSVGVFHQHARASTVSWTVDAGRIPKNQVNSDRIKYLSHRNVYVWAIQQHVSTSTWMWCWCMLETKHSICLIEKWKEINVHSCVDVWMTMQ